MTNIDSREAPGGIRSITKWRRRRVRISKCVKIYNKNITGTLNDHKESTTPGEKECNVKLNEAFTHNQKNKLNVIVQIQSNRSQNQEFNL